MSASMFSCEVLENNADYIYVKLLRNCMYGGGSEEVVTRNSKCRRMFISTIVFKSAPLVTVRKTAWKNALREMEWFLSGSNNINTLHKDVQHWWRPWADKDGYVYNNYSDQFTNFNGLESHYDDFNVNVGGIDQIKYLLDGLRKHPYSRRNVITTWNTADMVHPNTPITNCHGTVIQTFVDTEKRLHLYMYQRSCDLLLGVPHNWIQYWGLLLYFARHSGLGVGSFVWTGGDIHIYKNHYETVQKILDCNIKQYVDRSVTMSYDSIPVLTDVPFFKADNFNIPTIPEPLVTDTVEMVI